MSPPLLFNGESISWQGSCFPPRTVGLFGVGPASNLGLLEQRSTLTPALRRTTMALFSRIVFILTG